MTRGLMTLSYPRWKIPAQSLVDARVLEEVPQFFSDDSYLEEAIDKNGDILSNNPKNVLNYRLA